jgi:hypothetical protein
MTPSPLPWEANQLRGVTTMTTIVWDGEWLSYFDGKMLWVI